ncbi:entry exclusion lipoprotein TrbK [Variovorax sp. SRS16]|uniref:entry exclusion lipoprotein TrbK n=1 Tax=Variovorax sp. SRS16 TaxID=282217 RepID=UPI001E2EB6F7|nr:entry exclusion lipoprotein TrbK [Variovorax sp. SRS16]
MNAVNRKQLGRSAAVILALMALSACNPAPSKVAMPEVNDETCKVSSIKALPDQMRTPFADKCFTRPSSFGQASKAKTW